MGNFTTDIDDFFERLFENPTEERVNEYIIRELNTGRDLFSILQDPFIKNRIPEERRTQLLENPDIIDAFMKELNEKRDKQQGSLSMAICTVCGCTYEGEKCPRCSNFSHQSTTTFTPVSLSPDAPAQAQAHGKFSLTVVKGPQIGDYFTLDATTTTIGRDPKADIFLNDRTVSREHALIAQSGDTVILKDLGSLNGTYVDGTLIDEVELKSGEILQIGTFQLQFLRG